MIVLRFPLPPPELSPNASSPWSPGAKWFRINARKQYRRDVALACLEHCGANPFARLLLGGPRYRMTETYRIAGKRKQDVRNRFAAFKAGEDGLVDAGVLPGDDDSCLEHGAPRIERVRTKEEECVVVEIERLNP